MTNGGKDWTARIEQFTHWLEAVDSVGSTELVEVREYLVDGIDYYTRKSYGLEGPSGANIARERPHHLSHLDRYLAALETVADPRLAEFHTTLAMIQIQIENRVRAGDD